MESLKDKLFLNYVYIFCGPLDLSLTLIEIFYVALMVNLEIDCLEKFATAGVMLALKAGLAVCNIRVLILKLLVTIGFI